MNILRRALQIPQFLWESEEEHAWDAESNLFRKDMMRLSDQFACPSEPMHAKIQALKEIGNIAYIGGAETVKLQSDILPVMLEELKNPTGDLLRTQVIRTLSMMVHRNRIIQEKVCSDSAALQAVFDLITDATRVLNCRWCCYLLIMLISDNADAMQKIKDVPEAESILTLAANIDLPWLMWGGNHADSLLKILGFRAIDAEASGAHGAEFARYKDKRGRNVSIAIPYDSSSSLDVSSSTELLEAVTQPQGRKRESVLSSIDT